MSKTKIISKIMYKVIKTKKINIVKINKKIKIKF